MKQREAESETNAPLIIPEAPENTDDADRKTDTPVKYEYRELDDALKGEIRDELLQRKTRDAIEEKMQAAIVKMTELAGQRGTHRSSIVASDPEKYEQLIGPDSDAIAADLRTELAKFTPELLAGLKTWAEETGFKYFETPFLTYDEFRDGDNYPLGTAVEPGQTSFSMNGSTNAATRIYSSFGPEAANNDTQLFLPYRAASQPDVDEGTEVHFAYWAVDFSEPHVPALDEPGVRDRVILALKRQTARDILKKRADALVAGVKEGLAKEGEARVSMSDVLESKTITGDKRRRDAAGARIAAVHLAANQPGKPHELWPATSGGSFTDSL